MRTQKQYLRTTQHLKSAELFLDEADYFSIAIHMFNLLVYSDELFILMH